MLTLIHAPNSRSTRILQLIDEMGIADEITLKLVTIRRRNGSGGADAANPHPEAKVPALIHDGVTLTESGAIMAHLTTLFPQSGLAPAVGTPAHGLFLTWLFWYQGVLEPVMMLETMGLAHPGLTANFRGLAEAQSRIAQTLAQTPWLCGETYSAADLICASAFTFFPQFLPDTPSVRDWVARCAARPALAHAKAQDAAFA
jgi:glutathione S-transferase